MVIVSRYRQFVYCFCFAIMSLLFLREIAYGISKSDDYILIYNPHAKHPFPFIKNLGGSRSKKDNQNFIHEAPNFLTFDLKKLGKRRPPLKNSEVDIANLELRNNLLPRLSSHTVTGFTFRVGERLSLMAKGMQKDLDYYWLKEGEVICEGPMCGFSTKGWSIGAHKITLLCLNQHGSLRLDYRLRASLTIERDKDWAPPLSKKIENGKTVFMGDMFIRALRGDLFSFDGKKLTTVDSVTQRMSWYEDISTNSLTTAQFGISPVEEHFLLPRSRVHTFHLPMKRRAILLQYGTLRSRNLSKVGPPMWSIFVDDWLQVDSGRKGDVIVERASSNVNSAVRITALRGNVRVLFRNRQGVNSIKKSGESILYDKVIDEVGAISREGEFWKVYLTPTMSIELKKSYSRPPMIHVARAKSVTRVLSDTTPEYFYSKYWTKEELFKFEKDYKKDGRIPARIYLNSSFSVVEKLEDLEASVSLAKELISQDDFLGVLELLLPFAKMKISNRKEVLFLIGNAYLGIHKYNYAFYYLNLVKKVDPSDKRIDFQKAILYLLARRWKKASSQFEKIDTDDEVSLQRIYHYMGVTSFQEDSNFSALSNFSKSLYFEKDSLLAYSSKEFIQLVEKKRLLETSIEILYYSDSNVYRISEDHPYNDNIEHRSSNVVKIEVSMNYKAFQKDDKRIDLGINYDTRNYLLQSISLNHLEIYSNIKVPLFTYNDGKGNSYFSFRPSLSSKAVADATIDGFGLSLSLDLPDFILSPELTYSTIQYLDKKVPQEPLFDPISEELGGSRFMATKINSYKLLLNVLENENSKFDTVFEFLSNSHRDISSRKDDYSDSIIELKYDYDISKPIVTRSRLSWLNRTFSNRDDRSDSEISLYGKVIYKLSMLIHFSLFCNVTQHNSSDELGDYEKNIIGLGGKISF